MLEHEPTDKNSNNLQSNDDSVSFIKETIRVKFSKSYPNHHSNDLNLDNQQNNRTIWLYQFCLIVMFYVCSQFTSIENTLLILLFFSLFCRFNQDYYKITQRRCQVRISIDTQEKQINKCTQEQYSVITFSYYVGRLFWLILIIFILRVFIFASYQIPSSSMRPLLVKGDLIVVNKLAYHIRLPITNHVIFNTNKITRGDVVVFHYPPSSSPQINYIKRIVGVSGDVIEYRDKTLFVNGQQENRLNDYQSIYEYQDDKDNSKTLSVERYSVDMNGQKYYILNDLTKPPVIMDAVQAAQNEFKQNGYLGLTDIQKYCEYAKDGSWFKCTVPDGKYFAMGDNRDNSADSRYWGFVDDKLVVGKAIMVWLNIRQPSRIGLLLK